MRTRKVNGTFLCDTELSYGSSKRFIHFLFMLDTKGAL